MRSMQLIINGDDFGASEEINAAIVRAHQRGLLTSCSLMVTGDVFQQAVQLAKENEGLAVGLHVVTVQGRAVLKPADIPCIVDKQGNFANDPIVAGMKYFFSRRAKMELREEIEAQFDKFAAAGLTFSHVDSHLHMHVNPAVFAVLVEFCRQYDVNRMRVPEDDFSIVWRYDRRAALRSAGAALIFKLLCRDMRKRLQAEGFLYTERVYGHFLGGRLNERAVLHVLGQIRAATNEFYFHPAVPQEGGRLDKSVVRGKREFDVLMSPRIRSRLAGFGLELTTYPNLDGRQSRTKTKRPFAGLPRLET